MAKLSHNYEKEATGWKPQQTSGKKFGFSFSPFPKMMIQTKEFEKHQSLLSSSL